MIHRSLIWIASVLVPAVLLVAAPASKASPGPIQLVDSNGIEQADEAASPALSADGRFVAFVAEIGGQAGVFRKDLVTGELVPVFAGPIATTELPEAPSISAEGRYVSFTTFERLNPADDPEARTSDVYVADLATSPPTYELASAVGHCEPLATEPLHPCGLSYESGTGSIASGGVSLSANGREVVFVTTGASDLTGPGTEAEPFPTPALQVAVRNLETEETTLVSGTLDPLTGTQSERPVEGGAVMVKPKILPGASLSADGSTVAWLGQHLNAQVALPEPEAASIAKLESETEGYDEPLWRRIGGPTQRMVDGDVLAEMASGADATGQCQGPRGWNASERKVQPMPVLSGDGDRAALIGQPDGYINAFLVERQGPSFDSIRRLTSSPSLPQNNACDQDEPIYAASDAPIDTIAISPDGRRLAFATKRQRFPLSPPNLLTAAPVGIGVDEFYLADLEASSLERLSHGNEESEPSMVEEKGEEGTYSVSLDREGELLAFASIAYNLVPDDGNGKGNGGNLVATTGSDVFVVGDPRSSASPGSSRVSRPPLAVRPQARWILTAHASSRPDGSVRVAVGLPGAGRLTAVARTLGSGDGKVRKVASARRRPRLASVLAFVLRPARGLRPRVHAPGGLEATLRLHFSGSGGKPLNRTLNVRFRFHARGGKKHHK